MMSRPFDRKSLDVIIAKLVKAMRQKCAFWPAVYI